MYSQALAFGYPHACKGPSQHTLHGRKEQKSTWELTGAVQAMWRVDDGVHGAAGPSSRARCRPSSSRSRQGAAADEHGAVAVVLVPERRSWRAGEAGDAQHAAVQRTKEVGTACAVHKQRPADTETCNLGITDKLEDHRRQDQAQSLR